MWGGGVSTFSSIRCAVQPIASVIYGLPRFLSAISEGLKLFYGNRRGSPGFSWESGTTRFVISCVLWTVHLFHFGSGTSWTSWGGAARALGSNELFRDKLHTGCNS